MPQNWWEKFPEVMPSPAAGPYPLPGPGAVMPGPAMGLGPDVLSGAPLLGQDPVGPFDPSYFSGGPAAAGQFPGSSADQAMSFGYPQPPLAGDRAGALSDRKLAVQQAAAAIRDGADPRAVRARLNQLGMANPDVDPSDPYFDLLPGGQQGPGMMNPTQGPQPDALSAGQPPLARDAILRRYDLSGPANLAALNPSSDFTSDVQPGTSDVYRSAQLGMAPPAALLTEAALQRADPPEDPSTDMMAADERGVALLDQAASARRRQINPYSESNPALGASSPIKPEPAHPNARARLRLANEAELNDPRILAFLDTIAAAEGSDYHSLYGDVLNGRRRTFDDMLKHPGNVGQTRDGAPQSAAGRYQILRRTYNGLLERMGSLDMSPRSQDIMAVDLLRTSRALDALRANDFDTAVSNSSGPWASLPRRVGRAWQGGRYPNQGARSIEALRAAYNRALQYYSAPGPIPANNRPPLQIRLP
jgi:muramidase (phage lysozyme)